MFNSKSKADYWIRHLQMSPHPEGGFYCESYRAELMLKGSSLPAKFAGDRRVSTGIYFLLEGRDFSAFHRLASDELWHFYAGDSLSVHVLNDSGQHAEIRLGPDAEGGEVFQAVVRAGCWFASCLGEAGGFALVGCTVSPGFDFRDFEMGNRAKLIESYPEHKSLIERLTRESL